MEPVVRGKQPHQDHFSKNHVWVSKNQRLLTAHIWTRFNKLTEFLFHFTVNLTVGVGGVTRCPLKNALILDLRLDDVPGWRGLGGGAGLSVWAYGVAALGQSSPSNEHRPGLCAGAARRRVLIQYSDAHIQVILTASLLVKSHLCACVPGGER